jgi:hypothetical protein
MTRILNLRRVGAIFDVRSRWSRSHEAKESAGTIGEIVQELETLNRSTERDFLAVGDKLVEFRTSARQISSDMAAIAELIAGEQGRIASDALQQLLEHSRALDARIHESGQAFTAVRELSNRLRKAFSGLTHMVAVFRSLCTLTQIETARLGGAGADLGHLAAEIRPLSESIQTSGEAVVASSNRLDQAVQQAVRSGSELRRTHLKEMPVLIANVMSSLQAFEERRRLALESSNRQAAEYTAVSEAVDDLVGSIQFHDITRQQVEHALEALRQFRSRLTGGRAGHSALEKRTILALQASQLAEAARLFAESIERMDQDLVSIAGRLRNASEGVRELTGVSNDGGESFFQKMEMQFGAIVKMLGTCTAAQGDIGSTAGSLAETIAGMRTSVTDIRGTEIQIQRISTNATIRATHIGASGIALNKIAEVMQRLAMDSNASTDEAAATLEAMSEVSGRIAPPVPGAGKDASITPDAAAMQLALAGLHASSDSSAARVDHVAKMGGQLAGEIATLRERLAAGRMFAEVIGRARTRLETMGAQAAAASSEDTTVAGLQQLEQLAKTYTMQRQREVHESVLGNLATPLHRPEPKAAPRDGDLGDNVDLF